MSENEAVEDLFKALTRVCDYFNWDLTKRQEPDDVIDDVWGRWARVVTDPIVEEGHNPRCVHCPGNHTTAEHDNVLMERILRETDDYNRELFKS